MAGEPVVLLTLYVPIDRHGTKATVTITGSGPMTEHHLGTLLEYLQLAKRKFRAEPPPRAAEEPK